MKATGIVRMVDDLGRITIPRVIRTELNIKDRESLEFFIDTENKSIVLYKYKKSPLDEIISVYEGLKVADQLAFLDYLKR